MISNKKVVNPKITDVINDDFFYAFVSEDVKLTESIVDDCSSLDMLSAFSILEGRSVLRILLELLLGIILSIKIVNFPL